MFAQLQDAAKEPAGGLGAPAKFRLNYHLNRAANDVAAKYKCLYGTASGNLVINTVSYPAPTSTAETAQPAIIEIYAVSVYDSLGKLHTLQMETPQGLDALHGGWRTWLANTCPIFAVTLAASAVLMVPAPSYASAYDPTGLNPGGFTMEGIVIPGHSWDAATAECPLPTQIHEAIVDLATLYRMGDQPATKETEMKAERIESRMQSQMDTFESTILRYTQATRVPAYTTGENAGASPGYWFNPLDQ